MKAAPHRKRLLAALTVSTALHVTLVVLPYLGASIGVSMPWIRSGPTEGPTSTLRARLVMDDAMASAGIEDALEAPAIAEAKEEPATKDEPQPSLNRPAEIQALPMVGPTYFTADQLTKIPKPTFSPKLALPPELEALFGSGKVVLKLWIDRLGNVVAADVDQSNVPEPVAAKAAEAFGKLRFFPGEIRGRRVATMIQYEVTYEEVPADSAATVSPATVPQGQ
jgi:hypothetical protein